MAGSLNRATLIGRLGRDPEVKYTPKGDAVANFSIATSETWRDKEGGKKERTDWHRIVAWGKLGELIGQYCKKGSRIYVEGRIQTREWLDKDDKKCYMTEVIASNVTFLDGRNESSGGGGDEDRSGAPQGGDDDIPF